MLGVLFVGFVPAFVFFVIFEAVYYVNVLVLFLIDYSSLFCDFFHMAGDAVFHVSSWW